MAPRAKEKKEPLTVDDAWLEKYVNFSNPAVKLTDPTSGEQVNLEPTTDQADLTDVVEKQEDQAKKDKELNEALKRGKAQAQNEKKLHERAKRMDAASEERVAKEKQRELDVQREEAQQEEDERQAKSIRDVRHVTRGINQALQQNVQPAIEKVGTLPTLGGIGLMVGILLLLLMVVIPVNAQGDTRAKQFWYMLNGRAKLQGSVLPVVGSQVSTIDTTGGVPIKPDGSCPPGYHGAMANGQLFCQPDDRSITTTPAQNGAFHTSPNNLGF